MNRRDFVKNTALAGAGVTILNFPVFGMKAPSNKIVLAVMGVNSRGNYLASRFAAMENVEIAYICDVEDGAIKKGMDALKDAQRKPAIVKDIRKLVTQKDFDALVIAAPDHWHAPAALLGVANGKHVYVEKPCGHNPHEGELLIAASNKYQRLIQMGNQRRSSPTLIEAAELLKQGIIGRTYFGKAWYANNRTSIGKGKVIPVPSTLDFDLWQGPAPRTAYLDNLIHYNWHWRWRWGTGEACNNGTHELDCCRWLLQLDYPDKVTSAGGRYAFNDDWETPDTQVASFEFADRKAISWESRSCNNYPVETYGRGFIIYGENGTLVNDGGGGYRIFDNKNKVIKENMPVSTGDRTNTVSSTFDMDDFHLKRFAESIRNNNVSAEGITEGHKSILLCHLANIAQRTGDTLRIDSTNGHILSNKNAQALWSREYEKGWSPEALIGK
jgi:predicted dehydrogenase